MKSTEKRRGCFLLFCKGIAMLYNRLKLMNGVIVLLVLVLSVHIAASNHYRLSPIAEGKCEEDDYEMVTYDAQDSHELDDVDQMRAKSLDSAENFLDSQIITHVPLNDTQEYNQDLNLQKTHYDEVVAQLKARQWPAVLKARSEE